MTLGCVQLTALTGASGFRQEKMFALRRHMITVNTLPRVSITCTWGVMGKFIRTESLCPLKKKSTLVLCFIINLCFAFLLSFKNHIGGQKLAYFLFTVKLLRDLGGAPWPV